MKKSGLIAGLALLTAGALVIAGCAKKTETETTPPPAEAPTPDTGMGAPVDTAAMDTASHSMAPAATEMTPVATEQPAPKQTATVKKTTKPVAKATPKKTPAVPVADTKKAPTIVPAGTPVSITLSSEITTKTASEGDKWTGVVTSDVVVDGETVFPKGARVEGHVVLTERAGKSSGKSQLQLAYDRIIVHGDATEITSVGEKIEGDGSTSGDLKRIGGGAAAGAVVGGILGGKGGAAKGAVVGGAAGTAASLLKRAPDVTLTAGSELLVRLDRPVPVGGSTPEAVSK
jgi:hypothetical protein